MDLNFNGKRALVCGSTRGIGYAVALQLAKAGANVTLMARNEEALENALRSLHNSGKQVHDFITADFTMPEQVKQQIENYLSSHSAIHILVNNSGGPKGGAITGASAEDFRKAFDMHVICNQILATACFEKMKLEGYGRIINIISTSVKQPIKGLGVSNTVRAAVANWSKTWAGEAGPYGVTVNNVLPGATRTARLEQIISGISDKTGKPAEEVSAQMIAEIPAQRFADPDEIASAVVFLASPSAAYINGINLPVDGGRTSCL